MFLPSVTAFSSEERTLRMSASTSRFGAATSGSCIGSMRACRKLPVSSTCETRARERPCTRMRMRPSGSLSMRMMIAAVPTGKTSVAPGSSLAMSRCAASMIMRFSAKA
jgi:hypothetical protein